MHMRMGMRFAGRGRTRNGSALRAVENEKDNAGMGMAEHGERQCGNRNDSLPLTALISSRDVKVWITF
jgi:hypothetical protein